MRKEDCKNTQRAASSLGAKETDSPSQPADNLILDFEASRTMKRHFQLVKCPPVCSPLLQRPDSQSRVLVSEPRGWLCPLWLVPPTSQSTQSGGRGRSPQGHVCGEASGHPGLLGSLNSCSSNRKFRPARDGKALWAHK